MTTFSVVIDDANELAGIQAALDAYNANPALSASESIPDIAGYIQFVMQGAAQSYVVHHAAAVAEIRTQGKTPAEKEAEIIAAYETLMAFKKTATGNAAQTPEQDEAALLATTETPEYRWKLMTILHTMKSTEAAQFLAKALLAMDASNDAEKVAAVTQGVSPSIMLTDTNAESVLKTAVENAQTLVETMNSDFAINQVAYIAVSTADAARQAAQADYSESASIAAQSGATQAQDDQAASDQAAVVNATAAFNAANDAATIAANNLAAAQANSDTSIATLGILTVAAQTATAALVANTATVVAANNAAMLAAAANNVPPIPANNIPGPQSQSHATEPSVNTSKVTAQDKVYAQTIATDEEFAPNESAAEKARDAQQAGAGMASQDIIAGKNNLQESNDLLRIIQDNAISPTPAFTSAMTAASNAGATQDEANLAGALAVSGQPVPALTSYKGIPKLSAIVEAVDPDSIPVSASLPINTGSESDTKPAVIPTGVGVPPTVTVTTP